MCVFHVLQAVNRRMQPARLLRDFFTEIDIAFHEAVYTLNAERFNTLKHELCSVQHDARSHRFKYFLAKLLYS